MKKVYATFTGKDGSMGFKKNKEYLLEITSLKNQDGKILVMDIEEGHTCIYDNMILLLNNWDQLKSEAEYKLDKQIKEKYRELYEKTL